MVFEKGQYRLYIRPAFPLFSYILAIWTDCHCQIFAALHCCKFEISTITDYEYQATERRKIVCTSPTAACMSSTTRTKAWGVGLDVCTKLVADESLTKHVQPATANTVMLRLGCMTVERAKQISIAAVLHSGNRKLRHLAERRRSMGARSARTVFVARMTRRRRRRGHRTRHCVIVEENLGIGAKHREILE